MFKLLWISALLVVLPSLVFAHGGGLDAKGCHTKRATGEYHCHGAAQAASTAPTKPNQRGFAAPARPSGGPTCHVGPRGGTYTITPSGRKNYSGC